MSEGTKHAITNPTLWVGAGSLVVALCATAASNDWVKQNYPQIVGALLLVNTVLSGIIQALRDLKGPPAK